MSERDTSKEWKEDRPRLVQSVGGDGASGGPSFTPPLSGRGRLPWLRNLLVAAKMNVTGADTMKAGSALAERTGAHLSVVSVIEPSKAPEQVELEKGQVSEWIGSQQKQVRGFVETEFESADYKPKLASRRKVIDRSAIKT